MKRINIGTGALILLLCIFSLSFAGCGCGKKNYEENLNESFWDASYDKFTGKREEPFKVGAGKVIHIEVTTRSGDLSVKIQGKESKKVYCDREHIQMESFDVEVEEKNVIVILEAKKHNGSFSVFIKEKDTAEDKKTKPGKINENSSLFDRVVFAGNADTNDFFTYSVNPKAEAFIKESGELFSGKNKEKYKERLIRDITYADLTDDINRFGNSCLLIENLTVMKIKEISIYNGRYITLMELWDKDENCYCIYYDGEIQEIIKGQRVQVYATPIDTILFENSDLKMVTGIVLLAESIKKEEKEGNFFQRFFGRILNKK